VLGKLQPGECSSTQFRPVFSVKQFFVWRVTKVAALDLS
jgi:hypothetical protein